MGGRKKSERGRRRGKQRERERERDSAPSVGGA